MGNSKHTNEAWKSSLNSIVKNKEYIIETVSDGKLIARVQSEEVSDEEAEANAKLISEAPNLLEELQKMINVFKPFAKEAQYTSGIFMAEKAIEKATQ